MAIGKKRVNKKTASSSKIRAKTQRKPRSAADSRSSGISGKKKTIKNTGNGYRLIEGDVNPDKEHIGIRYGEDEKIVARIAPGQDKTFIVQYLIDLDLFGDRKGDIFEDVQRDITYYLTGKGEEKPWAYAIYHCGTAANLYSSVHWGWYPDSSVSEERRQRFEKNAKKLFACPKCKTQFFVTGTLSWDCPACGKAKLAPHSLLKKKRS